MTLLDRAVAAVGDSRMIGIVGPPGAGKSMLGEVLAPALGAVLVPMDGFHFPQRVLLELGRRDRMGAPDTFDAAALTVLLYRIHKGQRVTAPAFDRTIEEPVQDAIEVPADSRVVVEGNYLLLWPDVHALLDVVLYLPGDDLRLARLRQRHIDFGKTPEQADAWIAGVDEPNAAVIAATAARADVILE